MTAATICIYSILGLVVVVCVFDIGITWADPKGGASGDLPPVLTTRERIFRSIWPAITASVCVLLCFALWRFRRRWSRGFLNQFRSPVPEFSSGLRHDRQVDTLETPNAENSYAAPPAVGGGGSEASRVRVRSVARVFKILGWFGVVLYTPIVFACVGSLVLTLAGHRVDSPLVLAGACAFNGTILALAIIYVSTGRRVSRHDPTVGRRAIWLSCLMMIGFPLFTVVGFICYRNLRFNFNDAVLTAPTAEK